MPGFAFDLMESPVDWQFHLRAPSTICQFTDDKTCNMPRGKMLGGSSSINWMYVIRGDPDDFDEWARAGNDGWSYEDVLPYFKKFEGNQNEQIASAENGEYHGADGPVKITSPPLTSLDDIVISLLKGSGVEFVDDLAVGKFLGFTEFQQNVFNGTRMSTAQAYLTADNIRPNLHVLKHSYVDRVLLDENNVAYGVELTYKDKHKMRVNCTKEVIVSAGTIQSPTLLMRSGIGPKEHLEEHNIPCKADLAVGDNYIDHVFTLLPFKYENIESEPTPPSDGLYKYLIDRTGPLASIPFLTAEIDTANSTGLSDIQLFVANYPTGSLNAGISLSRLFNSPTKFKEFLLEANKDSAISLIFVTPSKSKSRGFIRLDETLRENITGNYLTDASDVATLVRGIEYFINLTKSEPFQKAGIKFQQYDIDDCDIFAPASSEYWKCYIKHISSPGAHQVGTSKMGIDSKSVVDPQLRVYNTTGLRQADCGM